MSERLLAWLAELTWRDGGGGDAVPASMIPTAATLAVDLRDDLHHNAEQLQHAMSMSARAPRASWQWIAGDSGLRAIAARRDGSGHSEHSLAEIHALWRDIPDPRPAHPLAEIVARWQSRPLPASDFRPQLRASIPRWQRVELGGDGDIYELPSTGIPGYPSWLQWMYRRVGGSGVRRGAPWTLRLHLGAMLHLRVDERDGCWRTRRFALAEIESWLFPDGWRNRRRDWHRLPAALDALAAQLGYLPVDGLGSVAVLLPTVIPRSPSDPLVEFTLRIPAAAAHGARVCWPRLCRYGAASATLFRAYLTAMIMLDHTAHHGHPATALIGRPLLDAAGRPRRDRNGRVLRSRDELMPSRTARFVRPLSDDALARLVGFDGRHREYRRRARRAFETLAADGVIELRRDRHGIRIFGARPASVS